MVQETGISNVIGCGNGGVEGEVEDVLEGCAVKEIRVGVWSLTSYLEIAMRIHVWCLV